MLGSKFNHKFTMEIWWSYASQITVSSHYCRKAHHNSGLILGLGPANEWWHYFVTTFSLAGRKPRISPVTVLKGKLWCVFCRLGIWFTTFYICQCCALCDVMAYWTVWKSAALYGRIVCISGTCSSNDISIEFEIQGNLISQSCCS